MFYVKLFRWTGPIINVQDIYLSMQQLRYTVSHQYVEKFQLIFAIFEKVQN